MKEKLIIIGAGLSGLYLASLLEEHFDITILEARPRIGGRIYSINGHDMGPSWVWYHHTNIRTLLQELDIEVFSQYNNGYALYDSRDKVELFTPQASASALRIDGSLSLLIEKLQAKLQNTKIILDVKVESIEDLGQKIRIKTDVNEYETDIAVLTSPPRLAEKVEYIPELGIKDKKRLQETQTWMGHSAKCVVVFREAFWKEKGLSGFIFSHKGPLGEVHDACTKDTAALFGFVSSNADMKDFKQSVINQMKRIFSIEDEDILDVHLVDWRKEKYTAASEDTRSTGSHPVYGIDMTHFDDKLFFSATEYAHQEGGYLEGAIIRAKEIASALKSLI